MAKKAEFLQEARKLKLDVSEKNTIAEISKAIEENKKENSVPSAKPKELGVVAKSGKRSAKSIKEADEKASKEARKAAKAISEETGSSKPKQAQKVRSKIERRGKKYQEAVKQIDKSKPYSLSDALELAVATNVAKFDATVELHLRLGVDPRQADQNIRSTITLPAGTGKVIRVAVYADIDAVASAKKAGADIALTDEFLQLLDEGETSFDVLIVTPSQMSKLGKYAKLLGPKGLMPNPKSGTVTNDVAKAVKEAKSGRVEYRVDSTGIIHVGIGKVSFKTEELLRNAKVLFDSVRSNKPTSIKGTYVRSAFVTTSMGPSILIDSTALN